MARDLKPLIAQMTLEEKAGLCSGQDHWHTKAIDRLGIPALRMSDGPHGLRKQTVGGDHLGLKRSDPATCFPPAVTAACSWDPELVRSLAEAIGVECQAEGVDVLLGPGVNLKRTPLCGRNFEYYSEDPFLAGELGKAYVEGLQSTGVGASLKHFAVNNQEFERFLTDSVVDERTLRELYLTAFEKAVIEAQSATVMCAYNQVNGTYCSEHRQLLTDILKTEWGHEGFVVSDWGAVNERVDGVAAGLELEMPPGHYENDRKIVAAVREGRLPMPVLDAAVERILKTVFRLVGSRNPRIPFDPEKHHAAARAALRECVVLLKNDDGILPLKKSGSLAVIGGFAARPRFQGGGSSFVTPYRIENVLDELRKLAGGAVSVSFAEGYLMDPPMTRYCDNPFTSAADTPEPALIREAVEQAVRADKALVFIGLPETYETEGGDRTHLRIPEGHLRLVEAVAAAQPNTVVVLSNGAPIEMPWLSSVKAVLEGYLGGQASGGAIADILFGEANPCGKLAETFPAALRDTPSYLNVPGKTRKVEYREGLFIGYRHYEAKEIVPLFPFGFGLSYTEFSYEKVELDKKSMSDQETLSVSVTVRNVGERRGKEIVQLYVRDRESTMIRPNKELKGFVKIELEPGESKTVAIELGKRAFAYWSTEEKGWRVESGLFEILVGPSSASIALRAAVEVRRSDEHPRRYTRNSSVAECLAHPRGPELMKDLLAAVKTRFALSEGTSRYDQTLAGIPIRCSLAQFGIAFTEGELQELLKKLNE
ncbi:MAG: glycoside hydrolase family 3 C-terminal domain-containing protein [Treponemataceae bacterium]